MCEASHHPLPFPLGVQLAKYYNNLSCIVINQTLVFNEAIISHTRLLCGGAVASWLVLSTPWSDQAVRVRFLGPVSRKPRKLFGPVKPFFVHLCVKTEKCIRLKLLVCSEPLLILPPFSLIRDFGKQNTR